MKTDLRNMLRSIAESLEDEDGQSEYGYAFMLRELSSHLEGLAEGKHNLEEFCEFYGLPFKERKAVKP